MALLSSRPIWERGDMCARLLALQTGMVELLTMLAQQVHTVVIAIRGAHHRMNVLA